MDSARSVASAGSERRWGADPGLAYLVIMTEQAALRPRKNLIDCQTVGSLNKIVVFFQDYMAGLAGSSTAMRGI